MSCEKSNQSEQKKTVEDLSQVHYEILKELEQYPASVIRGDYRLYRSTIKNLYRALHLNEKTFKRIFEGIDQVSSSNSRLYSKETLLSETTEQLYWQDWESALLFIDLDSKSTGEQILFAKVQHVTFGSSLFKVVNAATFLVDQLTLDQIDMINDFDLKLYPAVSVFPLYLSSSIKPKSIEIHADHDWNVDYLSVGSSIDKLTYHLFRTYQAELIDIFYPFLEYGTFNFYPEVMARTKNMVFNLSVMNKMDSFKDF
ncbi:uncharacterized protein L201_001502 [Kwoniella dendrophila CBS 6074]|uniref:Uncharacterized protein n=1 Tax=Kwoniella dendrophila CBS 6074 TaxID=1295534 RepID=A0AAX4JPZ6_9TREE